MVEREGLESQISNLLMNLDFLSPQFPSDPRFWLMRIFGAID
jgi:hypothetical protein